MILRPTYIKVNLQVFQDNIKCIRKNLRKDTELMFVLKDDAYGLGAIELAGKAIDLGISYFGVSNLQEAIELREKYRDIHILLLGYLPVELYPLALENRIQLNLWTLEMAEKLNSLAKEKERKAEIHISVDTGLSRLGCRGNEDSLQMIQTISAMENLEIKGVFSHFARTETEDDDFSYKQLSEFLEFTDNLDSLGVKYGLRHIADSGAIVKFPQSHLDMVRCGALALGSMTGKDILKEDNAYTTKAIFELYSQVARVMDVPKDTSVSYDGSYVSKKPIRVVTLPIGYGDGLSYEITGKMKALLNGKYMEQIGEMCMDMLMFDASGIECKQGDRVTLLGEDKGKRVSLQDWSKWSGLSPTFLQAMLRDRIPRIYKNE